MRISTVTITGMHKIHTTMTYTMQDINYLFGKNGAGKSTVMQAIQLALLGYIPGTDKNKSAIFRHASADTMSVYVLFDNNMSVYRKYEKTSKDIKVSVQTMPDGVDMASIIAELELPIFNFNEFAAMTANKLKDWFIGFLPDADSDINIEDELRASAPFVDTVDDTLIHQIHYEYDEFSGSVLDKMRKLNELCKANISKYKAEATRLTDTMQSLVHYDNCPMVSTATINQQIIEADVKLQDVRADLAKYNMVSRIREQLESLRDRTGCTNEVMFKKAIEEAEAKASEYKSKITEVVAEATEIHKRMAQYETAIAQYETIIHGHGKCPYTKTECNSITEIMDDTKAKHKEATDELHALSNRYNMCNSSRSQLEKEYADAYEFAQKLKAELDTFLMLSMTDTSASYDIDDLLSKEQVLIAEISKLREDITHIEANKKYDELKSTITNDLMKANQLLEIYKLWDKLTGVNGLQSTIMMKPFLKFSESITKYLTEFFADTSIQAHFHVGEKANSFSFGVMRNGAYIEFDMLSSGEKCLYTLAMLIAITEKSASDLKLILIDDLLDHLDDTNIQTCFATLNNIKDIQVILAGVQPCNIDDMVIHVM